MVDRSITYTMAARVAAYVSPMAEAAAVTELVETKQKQLTATVTAGSAAQASSATAAGRAVSTAAATQSSAVTRAATASREATATATAAAAATSASAQQAAAAITAGSATEQAAYRRSAASLREKLGLQALEGPAAERSAAANSKAAASAAVFNAAIDRGAIALAEETTLLGRSTAVTRANTAAREQATVAARAQQAASLGLSSANGLLGTSLTPLTAGLGATALGLGYAAYRGMEFDTAMSEVRASTGETGAGLDRLRNLAIDLGADTKYSSEEAAQGVTELSKAGVDTADIMGGALAGSLDLAAAGGLDVGQAAEIAATQLTVFNLSGGQASHVADLLAAGAGKAQGSVEDMALALQYAGLPAAGLGLSIEETTGTIALFASNGLIGEKAGTSFRGMLVSLTNPVGKTRELMDELGLSFFDAQGQFIGMDGVADQLQTRLGGLSEQTRNAALAQIFGNEALGAAQILYNGGASGVEQWTRAVNDAGYAQEYAADLSDNLRGDLERLGGAFDAAATTAGDMAQGPLRFLVQSLTYLLETGGDVIGFITDLPAPMQAAAAGVLALYLVTGPLSGSLLNVASGLHGIAGRAAGAVVGLGGVTGAATAARGAISSLASTAAPFAIVAAASIVIARIVEVAGAADEAKERVAELTATYDDGRGPERYQALAAALSAVADEADVATSNLREASEVDAWDLVMPGLYADEVQAAASGIAAAQQATERLTEAQDRADQSAGVLGRRYDMTRSQVEEFAAAHGIDLSGSLQIVQGDFMRVADAAGLATTGLSGVAGASETGYESFTSYAAALGLSDDATEELREHTNDLGESFADFIDPLGAYNALLDQKREADRAAAEATAAATASQTDSWEDYVTDVGVAFDQYMADLQEQVTAQESWQTNMLMLASRVSAGTLEELARMGSEGAPLVADLVTRSDAELDTMDDLFARRSAEATGAWGEQLTMAAPVLSQVAARAGQDVANSLAAQLQAGTVTVAQIAQQYGISIADGVNPVLRSLGQQAITVVRGVFGFNNADGNVVSYYANGGMENHVAQHAPAGAMRIWAEPETMGESYIPHAASKRSRSLSIWRETGRILQAPEAAFFADGGFTSARDVPRPSSTAPYGAPLSTAAAAAMQAEYSAAVSFLNSQAEAIASASAGPAGGAAIGGGWQALWNVVKAAIPAARINSTFRAGDPGYHGRGKAIDFGFGTGPGGAGSIGLASIAAFLYRNYGRTLAELIYDGIGDSTPDVKNGSDHVYNAATRREHANHVHAAVYADGGIRTAALAAYERGTRYVPRTGPAILHEGERVITREQNRVMTSREMSGAQLGGNVVSTTDARSYPLTVQTGPGVAAIVRGVRDAQADMEFLHG